MHLRSLLISLLLLPAMAMLAQTSSQFAAVQVSATVQKAPASITLAWTALPNTSSITIYRKAATATSWGNAIASPSASATTWTDNTVSTATAYEYKVVRVANGSTGTGYLRSGIEVAATDFRGKLVLLVDNTFSASLAPELAQLQQDLKADGWVVLRTDVSRTASVSSVRTIVAGHYNSDPANVKAVFIVGHVPVPYSGNQNPDGHQEHQGAWPADGYYGDVNGNWTDAAVNNTNAARAANDNVPGDGKFDQTTFPSAVELQVGRVDMYDMPAFAVGETQLMRNYLNKLHSFKTKSIVPIERAIIFDNLQWAGSPMAASGWRGYSTMVPTASITAPYSYGPAFKTYVNGQSYLWAYSSGGGLQATVNGVLTYNGADNIAITEDYATTVAVGSIFNMSFGSYFGDWDNKNNFLRAAIASGNALVNCWSAIPGFYVHHMGMGESIGMSTQATMNNTSLYTPLTDGWQGSIGRVHLGLMGDPTLRMRYIAAPSNLSISNSNGTAYFTWTASSEAVAGYNIDRIDANTGALTRVNAAPVSGTSYSNTNTPFVAGAQYMVRAVKLQVTPSGSYFDHSLGAFGTATGGGGAVDCLGVVGGTALPGTACNDNNACTINDVWTAGCQCIGTYNGPTATISPAGATTFCQGGAVALNANTGAGLTYTWQRNGTNITGATSGVLAAVLSGSYTVTVTKTGCSVVSAPLQVTVNPLPTITTSSNAALATVTASVAGTPGPYTYAWNTNPIQTTSTASVNASGTYTVGVTDGNGCSAISSVSIVLGVATPPDCFGVIGGPALPGTACNDNDPCTINDTWSASCQCVGTPSPLTSTITAGGPTTFCSGSSVTLSANSGAGYTYLWKRNGTTITGATGSTYSASQSGSHTVSITSGGCTRTSSATAVTVNPKPVIAITTGAGTLTANVSVAPSPYAYTWTTNPVQTTATASVTAPGTYTVGVTSANGCGDVATVTYAPPQATLCDGLRTESQTTWGSAPLNASDPATYMTNYFSWLFTSPDYLKIGCGTRTMQLTTAAAVTAFLPASGAAAQLPTGNTVNPGTGITNGLAAELVALKLTMKFDAYNPAFSSSQLLLKNLVIASGTFQGYTVEGLAAEADRKLGSCGSPFTYNQLRTAIRDINNGYEGGLESAGLLWCNGVLKDDLPEEVVDQGFEVPLEIVAFPNPLDDATTVVVPAPDQDETLTVLIFNSQGAVVADLFVGDQPSGQELRLTWDAAFEPMGVYFVRVQRGAMSAVARLVVQ